ncbi:MAG: hypothetical protein WEB88_10740 [Gemmatimonadota bacterium]
MNTDLPGLTTAVLRRAPGRTLPLTELQRRLASEGLEVSAPVLRRMLDEHPDAYHLTEAPDPFATAWGWTGPQREAYTMALRETGVTEPVRVLLVDGCGASGEPGSLPAAEALDVSMARLWMGTPETERRAELAAALLEARALRAALATLPDRIA